jgi:GNAT superfamily N-acetyltransferase
MALVYSCLGAGDARAFHALHLEGFTLEPSVFRYAPLDEADAPLADIEARLQRDYVLGAFDGEILVGVGGLARFEGARLQHKALLFGMYLHARYRSGEASNELMRRLIDEATTSVEIVTLTIASNNARPMRFYERWGFRSYGVELRSAKLGDGDYLDETLMAMRLT